MNAKTLLIGLNHILLMFGTTVYMGVLWSLRFFWYPSWETMNTGNVQDHFIVPTSAATKFFTIVVPIMFLTNAIMIWLEWRTKFRWHAVVSFLCISAATIVGWYLIIPVNKTIAAGVDESRLTGLLQEWMSLNDIRWIIITVMWITLMIYFLMKPSLSERHGPTARHRGD